MNSPYLYRGVVYTNSRGYTLPQQLHLIETIGKHQSNIYLWTKLSTKSCSAYLPTFPDILTSEIKEEFSRLQEQSVKSHVHLWVGFKPGHKKFCSNYSDRKKLIKKAIYFTQHGADGIYLAMDDTHPKQKVMGEDGIYHGLLIKELYAEIGEKFKGICGEEYHGRTIRHPRYWDPIFKSLPKKALITWTGAGIWNRTIDQSHFPALDWPLLLWDNYFASDSTKPEKAPTYPYRALDSSLESKINGVLINPNPNYPWQLCALYTSLDFLANPSTYHAQKSVQKLLTSIKSSLSLDNSHFESSLREVLEETEHALSLSSGKNLKQNIPFRNALLHLGEI